MDAWQEINSLQKKMALLEKQISRQAAIIARHPLLRCGDIIATETSENERVYTINERDVDALKTNKYTNVHTLPGDPGPPHGQKSVMFFIDDVGKRYILPSPNRLILVQDMGGDRGRHIDKNEKNEVIVPSGSKTLDLVVSDPKSKFHNQKYTLKAGRVYPGMQLISEDGETEYYLVFVEAHGNSAKAFSDTASIANAILLTVTVSTDAQGNVLGISVEAS